MKYDSGITPDNFFYFVEDNILTRFRDELANREKKIAEIREMINQGKLDDARTALDRYKNYAEELEKEIDPEKKQIAEESAARIRKALQEIEIPPGDRKEFVDDVLDKEKAIVTAAEIAGKIKDLCTQLSNLDPAEYSRVCRTEDDSETPRWQRELDKDLTDEQKKEVKEFVGIMGECFETSGRQCRCEDINIKPFAERCSVIAPLATSCDEGNEEACSRMEEIESEQDPFDLLPDYLREAVLRLEDEYDGDRIDNHMPPECREQGATNAKDCMKIMFEIHAPEECQQALEEGKINFNNEREARKQCERIMFEANAPEECVEAGLTNPKECGRLMFKENAPQECIDAGLTGETSSDRKKCEEIMRSLEGERGGEREHGGLSAGANCKSLQNAEERLKCYDNAVSGTEEFSKDEREWQWPEPCRKAEAFTRESCERVMNEYGEQQRTQFEDERIRNDDERQRFDDERRKEDEARRQQFENRNDFVPSEPSHTEPGQIPQEPTRTEPLPTEQPPAPTEEHREEPAPSEPTPTTSESGITGGVIRNDNKFFEYYFRF